MIVPAIVSVIVYMEFHEIIPFVTFARDEYSLFLRKCRFFHVEV